MDKLDIKLWTLASKGQIVPDRSLLKTPEQIEKFKEKYQSPEIFTLFNGELHVMKMPPQEQKEQKESRKKDAQQKNPAKGKKKNRSGEAR